jgi:hypothetical protein
LISEQGTASLSQLVDLVRSIFAAAEHSLRRWIERFEALKQRPQYRMDFDEPGRTQKDPEDSDQLSAHSFSVAIYIDPDYSGYWYWNGVGDSRRPIPLSQPHPYRIVHESIEAFEPCACLGSRAR